jgi:hypothetical protein
MSDIPLERLFVDDVPEVADFLNRCWGAGYGLEACPVFDARYLQWLYGGPQAETTRLFGYRCDGRLVAFRSYLARTVVVGGSQRLAFLNTHLGVDAAVPIEIRRQLVTAFTVRPWQSRTEFPPIELTYSAIDAGKGLSAKLAGLYTGHNLNPAFSNFAHTLVLARRSAVAAPDRVRRATLDDVPVIARVHERLALRCDVALHWTEAEIAHHWFAAPDSAVYVAENADGPSGAACFYRLDTMTGGRTARVAICEMLLADSAGTLSPLLDAGLAFQHRIGAKGLVCENATYLPLDLQRACGLVPSMRQMRFLVVTPDRVDIGERWLVDVK